MTAQIAAPVRGQPPRPPDPLPDDRQWRGLTVLPRKRRDYAEDLDFRECWWDVHDLLGDRAVAALRPLALLGFKPDAVVGRRITAALDFCAAQGFVPVAAGEARLDRNAMRALWRWNWNRLRVDRLDLCTLLFATTGMLVVLLADVTQPPGPVPAAVRLANLKGGYDATSRPAGSLRSELRSVSGLFTFVHAADEPADVVRELAVFFDRAERRRMLAEATGLRPAQPGLAERIGRLEAAHPAHDLDARRALDRLAARPGGAAGAAALTAALATGTRLDWMRMRELVAPLDVTEPAVLWDVLSVASELLVMERLEAPDLLPTPTVQDWLEE